MILQISFCGFPANGFGMEVIMGIKKRGRILGGAAAVICVVIITLIIRQISSSNTGNHTKQDTQNNDMSVSDEVVNNVPDNNLSDSYVTTLEADCIIAECGGYNGVDYDLVKWFEKGDSHYLFLPSGVGEEVTLWETFDTDIYLDDELLVNGEQVSLEAGEHIVKAEDAEYNLCVMRSENVPAIFIEASEDINYLNSDKSNKSSGDITFIDADGSVSSAGLNQIKGRGNSSWEAGVLFGKYPYNLKLSESTQVFSIANNKKWCLIAQVFDESLIRNIIMNDLAHSIGLEYTPTAENTDVYYNGEYIGTYLLSQRVDIGSNSLVDIYDLEKATENANEGNNLEDYTKKSSVGNLGSKNPGTYKYFDIPNDPEDITGGYLIEFELGERYDAEDCGFVTDRSQIVVLKSPSAASKSEVEYIRDYVQRVEDAIYSEDGYNSYGEHYSELIDVESFAKVYLLNEFSMNLDSGATSFYMYKDVDGVLFAGPIWDYDWSLGAYAVKDGVDLVTGDKWFVKNKALTDGTGRALLSKLCTHDDFWNIVIKVWNESLGKSILSIINGEDGKGVEFYGSFYYAAAAMNFTRYDILDKNPDWGSADTGDTYEENIEYLKEYMQRRYDFMNESLAVTR